jgi:hypothetical protein
MVLSSLVLFCATASVCQAQTHEVVCNAGSGNFEAEFHTGVKVQVGAARNGELATRACEAALSWNRQKLVIAAGATWIDVDALGVNLGVGVPVVTIQVKRSDAECCMSYQIYSLEKPPRLLRTIAGGYFSAADTDLDGRVEIWADDFASVEGFENLDMSQMDFPPTIVLRFATGQLLDVSSEFRSYFDEGIAKVRAALDSQELRDFKSSDGRLVPAASSSPEDLRHSEYLQGVKLKVLEIIWSYVYSGREQEAWHSLADMWPTADVDRIRGAILKARARGISAQVDGGSTGVPTGRQEHATIFDGIHTQIAGVPTGGPTGRLGRAAVSPINKPDLVLPEPIEVWLPPSMGASEQVVLDLLIDSAGKVRSAGPAENAKSVDTDLMHATAEWKFIPAFKDGRAVASRVRLPVTLKR